MSSTGADDAPARVECLALLVKHLGPTEVGRTFGVRRMRSFGDLRASVPLMDLDAHLQRVEAPLGFGVVEPGAPEAALLAGADREREGVLRAWTTRMGGDRPRRVAVLQARADDPVIDELASDDLRALMASSGAELLRVDAVEGPAAVLERLRGFRPDAVAAPSAWTIAWLEAHARAPIERSLPGLQWLLVEHDLNHRLRSRLPLLGLGLFHRAGRLALPGSVEPRLATVLAVGSTLLELLPQDDGPLEDGRIRRATATVLPEQAIVGARYELVVSSALGFLRLRTGTHVRVVSFEPPTAAFPHPRPRVIPRLPPPPDVQVEGMTLPGAWLTAAVRQGFQPEDPALVAAEVMGDPATVDGDPRVTANRFGDPFADTELGTRHGERRRARPPRAVVVRVEVQGQMAPRFPADLARRIDANLARRSSAYRYLRERNDLSEPRIVPAEGGTRRAGQVTRIKALAGRVGRPIVEVVDA